MITKNTEILRTIIKMNNSKSDDIELLISTCVVRVLVKHYVKAY